MLVTQHLKIYGFLHDKGVSNAALYCHPFQ